MDLIKKFSLFKFKDMNTCREIAMSAKKEWPKKNNQTYCRRDLGDSGEKKPDETLKNRNSD